MIHNSKFRINTVRGFTLIEILIVVAITSLLSAYLILYNGTNRQQVNLSVEQAKLSQVIFRAKSLAVATATGGGLVCGYGVYLDYAKSSYAIFRYTQPSCNSISAIDPADSAHYTQVDSATLASPLILAKIGNTNLGIVFFKPPNPNTILWDTDGVIASSGTLTAHLQGSDSSLIATVNVSTAGEISF